MDHYYCDWCDLVLDNDEVLWWKDEKSGAYEGFCEHCNHEVVLVDDSDIPEEEWVNDATR